MTQKHDAGTDVERKPVVPSAPPLTEEERWQSREILEELEPLSAQRDGLLAARAVERVSNSWEMIRAEREPLSHLLELAEDLVTARLAARHGLPFPDVADEILAEREERESRRA